MSQINQFPLSYGGLILFLIVMVEQGGVPLPAAPFLMAAGASVANGRLHLVGAILCGTIGSLAADAFWFYAGRRSKARLFQLFPHWHPIRYAVGQKTRPALILRGLQMLTTAKFLPLGILVPLRAGAFEVGQLRFLLVDAICSLFYSSLYLLLGFFFHNQLEQVVKIVRRFGTFAFVLILLLVSGYYSSRILKRVRFRKGHAHTLGNEKRAD